MAAGVRWTFCIAGRQPFRHESKVNELLENAKEKIVLIKADEEVEYGAVMAAMDQLRQAGIEDIGLITERKKGTEGAGGK